MHLSSFHIYTRFSVATTTIFELPIKGVRGEFATVSTKGTSYQPTRLDELICGDRYTSMHRLNQASPQSTQYVGFIKLPTNQILYFYKYTLEKYGIWCKWARVSNSGVMVDSRV